MKTKSFFASDMNSALVLARRELGSEAMLLDSRPTPPGSRHLGEFEVVVSAAEETDAPFPAAPAEQSQSLPSGMAELQRRLERIASTIAKASLLNAGETMQSNELAEAVALLTDNEVDVGLAQDIVSRMRGKGLPSSASGMERMLRTELAGRFGADATLGRGGEGPKIVALVGPCASGKTTTLVKLAVRYGLSGRRPTQILSTDCYRIAAAEQLRSYATILGVGFQALETTAALGQALAEFSNKELILIDTPGFGPRDMDAAGDLARFLAGRADVDTHLVLTASTKSADLTRVVDRFEVFRPRKLLFTKLDETETFGPIVNEAARTRKPVSFLGSGQEIPDDLEVATTERILELVLRREQLLAAAAA